MEFLQNLWDTMLDKPYILWSVVACLGALLVLIILLIVLGATKKKAKNKVVAENLDAAVEETVAEEVIEEEEPVEEKEETPVVLEPASEEENVIETEQTEEAPVEKSGEEVTEPVKKTRGRKKKAAQEVPSEEPSENEEEATEPTSEVPAEESSEEQVEEPTEVKKPRGRKKKEEVVEETPVAEEPVKKTRVVYGKYEVYTDGASHYYTLKASNGEVLIKSEAYATRESVLAAIEAIKRNVEVGTISVRQDKHGLYQFVLVAKNHRTLVMSANYATEKRATSASESFKRFASNSPIVELAEIVESNKEEYKPEGVVDKKGGKLSLVTTENGFYYTLKASNGEVLVHSDTFKTLISAENAMKRFKESVTNGKFYIEVDKRENYQFKLFAQNGRIVCVGQIYATKALAVASINSVCSFINLATRVDE